MTQAEIYHRWRRRKQQVDVSPDFAERVIREIRPTSLQAKPCDRPCRQLITRIDLSAWAKVAVIAIASLIGLGRVLLTLHLLLSL